MLELSGSGSSGNRFSWLDTPESGHSGSAVLGSLNCGSGELDSLSLSDEVTIVHAGGSVSKQIHR